MCPDCVAIAEIINVYRSFHCSCCAGFVGRKWSCLVLCASATCLVWFSLAARVVGCVSHGHFVSDDGAERSRPAQNSHPLAILVTPRETQTQQLSLRHTSASIDNFFVDEGSSWRLKSLYVRNYSSGFMPYLQDICRSSHFYVRSRLKSALSVDFFFCSFRFVTHLQCLTVQLYEHQMQGTQWMYDQEMLEGGSKRHLWAELPAHPDAPSVCVSWREQLTKETPH